MGEAEEYQTYDDEPYADFGPIGCGYCGHAGWHHGCCDDLCRNCYEPEDCPQGKPCRHCNPYGE